MEKVVRCEVCGVMIPAERVEALPGVTTCVAHSREQIRKGFMVSEFSKGTAPALVIIPPSAEAERLADRVNRRAR